MFGRIRLSIAGALLALCSFVAGNIYVSAGLGIYILSVSTQHAAALPQIQNIAKEHAKKLEPRERLTEERPEYVLPNRI
jgi:hypothetical protein